MSDTTDPAPQPQAEDPTPAQKDTAKTLMRGLMMLIFAVFMALAENVLILIALIQLLWMLFTGKPNDAVRDFGRSLAVWMAETARFQSAASEEKPFPWKKWPAANEAPQD